MEISTEILLISQVCGSFVFKRERGRESTADFKIVCNTVFMLRRDSQFHLYTVGSIFFISIIILLMYVLVCANGINELLPQKDYEI